MYDLQELAIAQSEFHPSLQAFVDQFTYQHTPASSAADSFDELLLFDFQRLLVLRQDWDGDGAPPPSESVLINSANFLRWASSLRDCTVTIGPAVDGGVAFDFRREGRFAEVEFCNDNSTIVVTFDGQNEPRVITVDPDRPNEIIAPITQFFGD